MPSTSAITCVSCHADLIIDSTLLEPTTDQDDDSIASSNQHQKAKNEPRVDSTLGQHTTMEGNIFDLIADADKPLDVPMCQVIFHKCGAFKCFSNTRNWAGMRVAPHHLSRRAAADGDEGVRRIQARLRATRAAEAQRRSAADQAIAATGAGAAFLIFSQIRFS